MNEKTYPIDVRGDMHVIVGQIKVQGISEYSLAGSVLAPVLKIEAGTGLVEVIGFSIIPGKDYQPHNLAAAVEEAKNV